jgi:hypothetical protein
MVDNGLSIVSQYLSSNARHYRYPYLSSNDVAAEMSESRFRRVIASEAKQSSAAAAGSPDCFVGFASSQ